MRTSVTVILLLLITASITYAFDNTYLEIILSINTQTDGREIKVTINNKSNKEATLRHPNLQNSISFIIYDDRGNLMKPIPVAKVHPKGKEIRIAPRSSYEHVVSEQLVMLADNRGLSFPYLSGTGLWGYRLEQEKSYSIIAVYRPNGTDDDGITSIEKRIDYIGR